MFQPQFQQRQPPRPQAPRRFDHPTKPVIIEDPELFYEGKQFKKFLTRFERMAYAYGASNHNKAVQILRFIQTEELKCQLEDTEGYNNYNWTKLWAEMVKAWGDLDNSVMYTVDDLVKVAKDQAKKGIPNHQEYKAYLAKFTLILKYLVNNKHISKKSDAGILFLQDFSAESQRSIKCTLVNNNQLPKAKDRSNKAPEWDNLVAAAETETPKKEEDGRRRDQMLRETPNERTVEQKFQDMQQKFSALKQQLKAESTSNYNHQAPLDKQEYNRGNTQPSTLVYNTLVCYYCKREGHSTARCPEYLKDEEQGLVKQNGKDCFLPDVMKSLVQSIHWSPPTLGAENFIKAHPITRSEAQKGRCGVRIQEPEQVAMDIDHEEEESNNTPKDTLKKTPEKVWSQERVPTILKKDLPEEALLQDLDNVKIPTTFAQLTTISPLYTEKVIARLQERLPGKSTSTTYIKTEATNIAAPMTIPVEEEDLSDPCY
ncbi:hypothetical protein PTTG_29707 [Puccinia triticina 1-1 BBBD Race 1]|uniref:CCHC-type domain-containing protein n=1 Tax=Puccinia triticina (isolate 1-1 / race 1 (BBBD)) TaxID=630390 RepID=A0A180G4P9_PUCT1|nr:hypothetical protein PTTG_29707 [Puccinia triticina 1-1 BBBD Race 1]